MSDQDAKYKALVEKAQRELAERRPPVLEPTESYSVPGSGTDPASGEWGPEDSYIIRLAEYVKELKAQIQTEKKLVGLVVAADKIASEKHLPNLFALNKLALIKGKGRRLNLREAKQLLLAQNLEGGSLSKAASEFIESMRKQFPVIPVRKDAGAAGKKPKKTFLTPAVVQAVSGVDSRLSGLLTPNGGARRRTKSKRAKSKRTKSKRNKSKRNKSKRTKSKRNKSKRAKSKRR